ncbi:MAG: hypothetical protein Kow0081_1980 [Candidatus Dojkabacteria bacterium]
MITVDNLKKQNILDALSGAQNIAIVSHVRPDHDAILSAILIHNLITKYLKAGNNVKIIFESEIEFSNEQYPGVNLAQSSTDISSDLNNYDTAVFLDGDELNRFSRNLTQEKLENLVSIRIDHHAFSSSMYTHDISTREAVSTTQLIYEYFLRDYELTPQEYEYILTGLLADVGFFRYLLPTTYKVLVTVSEVLDKVFIDLGNIYVKLNSFSKNNFNAVKELMNNTHFVDWNEDIANFSYSFIDNRNLNDTAGVYQNNILRLSQGYPWGFVAYWIDNSTVKISFRALHRPDCPNVRELAKKLFNGGVHVGASGASLNLDEAGIPKDVSLKKVCEYVVAKIKNNFNIVEKLKQKYEPT